MDLMPGNLLRMICHRFDLPLPVFRGSKGRIRIQTSGRRGVLHLLLYCTCKSPFLSPFLFYSWVSLFFLDYMAVSVFVVCMYVAVVWWGSSLSLSLWIVAGMVVVGQDSRADGEAQWPDCNCRHAEGLEKAIARQPTAIS